MDAFEFIGELCTLDSALVRGWRWLFSARYREGVRSRCIGKRAFSVVAGVLETILMMVAEVVALVLILRWILGP
jgi:hypothetical protein